MRQGGKASEPNGLPLMFNGSCMLFFCNDIVKIAFHNVAGVRLGNQSYY